MAGNFNKALGNTMIKKAVDSSSKNANVPIIEYIDIDLLDENPDNQQIFNMEDIKGLMRSIEENGFTGAVEVFKKPDGRYEISSGHRRVRAMKELGRDKVPCLVNSMPNDIVRAKKLLDSNITNRTLHPLDYARSIEYYIAYVLKPSNFKGKVDEKCAEYFNISPSAVYKYRAIVKMIPELQELANDPQFPYTGFVSAHRLSPEMQKKLYEEIKDYSSTHTDENGNPIEVSRMYIEQTVRKLLKEEDRYRESNIKIAEKRRLEQAQKQEGKMSEDSAEQSDENSSEDPDVMPLPSEDQTVPATDDEHSPLPVYDNTDDDSGSQESTPESSAIDALSSLPDEDTVSSVNPFNSNGSDSNPFEHYANAPASATEQDANPAEQRKHLITVQSEVFQTINSMNNDIDRITASIDSIEDVSRLKNLLTPLKDKIDSILESI